ncbi:MAG: hypothetical protein ACPLPX_02850 [Candidatus Kapaibacteriota bacterium]
MEVKSIKNTLNPTENVELKGMKKIETQNPGMKNQTKDILELTDWQQSVVEIALKYLENKSQMENNHPLSQSRFKQIQTLEEALKELEETRTDKFKEEALNAQANIRPEDIVTLFTQ